jgi:hypothetical protein
MIHSRKQAGWVIPWAHGLKHMTLAPDKAKIINVVGESVPGLVINDASDAVNPGTYFDGKFPTRAFEPLVSLSFPFADCALTKLLLHAGHVSLSECSLY